MSSASKPASPRRVLLVEEQPGSRDLIILVLSKLDYLVASASDFAAAVELLQREACACVLLSSTLPDCGGAEAVRRLRSRFERAPAPVIFVIGDEDQELRSACLKAGAQAYLLRPVEIERLLRLLKHSAPPRARRERPAEHPEPVIELDRLFGFTDGDPQLERELAALYLSTAEVYLQRMQKALESGEPWQGTAHALKGASSNLGALRVASLALAAERSEPSDGVLAALLAAVADVRRFFEGRQPSD